MNNLPSNWQVKSLGEVARFINGKAFKPEDWGSEGLPIIRIQNLTGFNNEFNYYKGAFEEKYLVKKNDILISWSASLGVYVWDKDDAVLNQHIFKVELKNGIDRTFFYYLIKTKIDEMIRQVHGSTMKHITKDRFDNIKVKLPPLPIQKQIAEILEKADLAKQKRKEANKLTDEFLQSVFIEMFGDPVKNSKGWQIHTLNEVCNKITDGTHDTPKRLKEGVKFITGKNIRPFYIDFTDLDFVTQDVHNEIYRRCNPVFGDILYTNIGISVGTAVMNNLHEEFSMKNVALLKGDSKKVNSRYLEHLLNNPIMKSSILNSFSIGGAQSFLSLNNIKRIKIPVPLLLLQQQFAELVNKTESLKEKQKNSEQELENLFQSLMQKAFKGELTDSSNVLRLHISKVKKLSPTDLHAGIIAKILKAHLEVPEYLSTLGHVKTEKISHIIESHLEIDLGRNPKRIAAGPADFKHLKKVEHRAKMKNWFTVFRREDENGYKYKQGNSIEYLLKNISEELGDKEDSVNDIIGKFVKLKTEHAEIVATVYAAWNDLLFENKTPSDDEIVSEARENWTSEKMKLSKDKFFSSIDWLKRKNLIPLGKWKRTH